MPKEKLTKKTRKHEDVVMVRHNGLCSGRADMEELYDPIIPSPYEDEVYYTVIFSDHPSDCSFYLNDAGKLITNTKFFGDEMGNSPFIFTVYKMLELIRQEEWWALELRPAYNDLPPTLRYEDRLKEARTPFMEDLGRALSTGLIDFLHNEQQKYLKNRKVIFGDHYKVPDVEIQLAWHADANGASDLKVTYAPLPKKLKIGDCLPETWRREIPYLSVKGVEYKPHTPYYTSKEGEWSDYRIIYALAPQDAPHPGAKYVGLVLPGKKEVQWLCWRAMDPIPALEKLITAPEEEEAFEGPDRRVIAMKLLYLIAQNELGMRENYNFTVPKHMHGAKFKYFDIQTSDCDAVFSKLRNALEEALFTAWQFLHYGRKDFRVTKGDSSKGSICEIKLLWDHATKTPITDVVAIPWYTHRKYFPQGLTKSSKGSIPAARKEKKENA